MWLFKSNIFWFEVQGKYTIHFSNILRYLVEFHIGQRRKRYSTRILQSINNFTVTSGIE